MAASASAHARLVVLLLGAWSVLAAPPPTMCWCGGFDLRLVSLQSSAWRAGGYNGNRSFTHGAEVGEVCDPGSGAEFSAAVWRSLGGAWQLVTAQAPWTPRHGHGLLAARGRLWVLGGRDESAGARGDVWASQDRVTVTGFSSLSRGANGVYIQQGSHGGFPFFMKADHAAIANTMYIYRFSESGTSWWGVAAALGLPRTQLWAEIQSSSARPPDGAWVVNINMASGAPLVAKAVDGTRWTELVSATSFVPREGHGVEEFGQHLFVMGGADDSGSLLNDVWNSQDGASWTLVTATAPWGGRQDFGTAVLDGRLWILGGSAGAAGFRDDVWYSSDGAVWTQATSSAAWGPRVRPGVVAFASRLWVMGGYKFKATQSFRAKPHQRHWSPNGSVVEVSYASPRLAVSDVKLSGGVSTPVIVSSVRKGGFASSKGVKAGNRLVSVQANGEARDLSAFLGESAGGVAAKPAGDIRLGFADPDSSNPHQLSPPQVVQKHYGVDYEADVWSANVSGAIWTLESEHAWSGLDLCLDSFGALVHESGPSLEDRTLSVMNVAGVRLYSTAPVYYATNVTV
eukprot:TRINITY_DN73046_c0_g1_i1.p1 TRINITY_DN73046_c0_g1~~TRINITY_DN73046_c0_g1_i1.p1  ORF type:complete len:570 (+),score=57.88 TRINITY_DN73046_c0_g1_i1:73-1782(+)